MAKGKRQRMLHKLDCRVQQYCIDCSCPITQNKSASDARVGLCNRCYNLQMKEHNRRKIGKQVSRKLKSQRKFKDAELCL